MMKNSRIRIFLFIVVGISSMLFFSFEPSEQTPYSTIYFNRVQQLVQAEETLLHSIHASNLNPSVKLENVKVQIASTRKLMKQADFWLRYLEPTVYKLVNGPLPVEWETEVFEKYEKPYKREGAGLTLAWQEAQNVNPSLNRLSAQIQKCLDATKIYLADSITNKMKGPDHFYLCNRLFLLNLAAIYTTGFECPDEAAVIPELIDMLQATSEIYTAFNQAFPNNALPAKYLQKYQTAISFVQLQSRDFSKFDHFTFIKEHVTPLFELNQEQINHLKVKSSSFNDYTLNQDATKIFSKQLYTGQLIKGIFQRVTDPKALTELDRVGKLLFYDPILSVNNQRSCASCHKPSMYFTDTVVSTALHLNRSAFLPRNTPSLLNVEFNHLLMLDGKHTTLMHQAFDVITNQNEMGSDDAEALKKVLSCKDYRNTFAYLAQFTPMEPEVTLDHVLSTIIFYYSKFSKHNSPFDDMMNQEVKPDPEVVKGFNVFMSSAKCGTCHFPPHFNGVKPPYIGSEFEVLGVPADPNYQKLSDDLGRYAVNPADETKHAFRTGNLRNIMHTAPYMHNGVFKTMDEVLRFYNNAGGVGHGFDLSNQTLPTDSLQLNDLQLVAIKKFMESLSEDIVFEPAPKKLPVSTLQELNNRKVGGAY